MDFENHLITWLASIFCCLAIVSLIVVPVDSARPIYDSNLFLPTYTVGIFSWLLHGFEIGSYAIILPCIVQLIALIFLLKRAISSRQRGE